MRNGDYGQGPPRVAQAFDLAGIANTAGFYKRGCQEKTLFPSLARKKFPDIQPPYAAARLGAGA